jgi:hypothetical protein
MGQTTLGLLSPFAHGRGYRSLKSGTTPAAGANFTDSIPGDKWRRLVGITFTLTASAAAANRIVTIDYARPDKGRFLSDGAAVALTANGVGVYNGSAQRTTSEWNTGTNVFFPLWGGFLESGFTVGITVANIDGSDQLSGIILSYETFEVGRGGYLVGGVSTDEHGMPETVVPDTA